MPHIDIRRPLSISLLSLLLFDMANWLMPLTDPVEAIYGQVMGPVTLYRSKNGGTEGEPSE